MSKKMTSQEAIVEAKRCLHCATPSCRLGCPINNDIPAFIHALSLGNFGDAFFSLVKENSLPAICGRLCAHEKQCEPKCVLSKDSNPINISALETFLAEFSYDHQLTPLGKSKGSAGKIAVIGSGPTGLSVAGELAKKDFDVTVYEGQHELGGVLLYGIPEFRLDKNIVHKEIDNLGHYGVKYITGALIGKDLTLDDLFAKGYKAIFIGIGSALPKTLAIPGHDLTGILSANYFLRMVILANSGKLDNKETLLSNEDEVVIIGGGNVAIDAARIAVARGARLVTVVYHKSPTEMSCLATAYTAALKEGIQFKFLRQPTAYLNNKQMRTLGAMRKPQGISDNTKVSGIMLQHVAKDAKGNFIHTGGQDVIACTCVILAIGQRPAASIFSTTNGIKIDEQGFVITKDHPYGMTTRPGVFSAGDAVNGPSTVVLAIEDSKKVVKGITEYVARLQ
ncbi:MAG: FAD-dependent oxidoreductase [Acidaminococcaceae bacterium]|nr:FAD-dependent oxidoreductase [Acidaminococcaceae bacterium]